MESFHKWTLGYLAYVVAVSWIFLGLSKPWGLRWWRQKILMYCKGCLNMCPMCFPQLWLSEQGNWPWNIKTKDPLGLRFYHVHATIFLDPAFIHLAILSKICTLFVYIYICMWCTYVSGKVIMYNLFLTTNVNSVPRQAPQQKIFRPRRKLQKHREWVVFLSWHFVL